MTNSDSIRSKLFEEGGGRFGGALVPFMGILQKVSPAPSNIHNLNNDTDPT